MKELNKNDLEKINGGVGPAGAAFGAFTGAVGYLGGAATSGNFSVGGLVSSTVGGAITGFIGGPVTSAMARYLIPRVAGITGAVTGKQ